MPIDALSFFMGAMAVVLSIPVLIYSFSYIKTNLFRYYVMFFITLAGILGAVLAKDFLSFYIFLEIMSVGTYFLVIHNQEEVAFKAGFKYIIMVLCGGILILLAILFLYSIAGSFKFSDISKISNTIPSSLISLTFVLFSIGCLVKIGAVPFHIWLPDAHPAAPTPISALLSGIAIKIGAYGIIRMYLTIFKFSVPRFLSSVIIIVGVISMLFGVILALLQTDIKRLLAYHSISQMGYVLLGIGIGSTLGIAGGLFHILNHATFKTLLFLCMGAVIFATGERELSKLGGLGRRMPINLITFCIGALAISGIPPFNGFLSKAMISDSTSGSFILKIILILTAACTFASFFKLFRSTFLGNLPEKLNNSRHVPFLMLFSMSLLACACFVVGIYPNKILNNLILPASGSFFVFNFWNIKTFTETFLIILLGSGIYILGLKTGFLEVSRGITMPSFFRFFSFNKVYCYIAGLIERSCVGLRKIHTRDLDSYLLWIFLTLLFMILLLQYS